MKNEINLSIWKKLLAGQYWRHSLIILEGVVSNNNICLYLITFFEDIQD